MVAPRTRYSWLKQISTYFPKRLLLSFLVVLAFPKAWSGTESTQLLPAVSSQHQHACFPGGEVDTGVESSDQSGII